MNRILELSLAQLSRELKALAISPVEVTEACLDRINATDRVLGAYVRILEDGARVAAKQAEAEILAGDWKGHLHGVPVALKDLYDLGGVPTTGGSRVRADWTPEADGATAAQLKKSGAIILGKTTPHEFAYGITTPAARNPWDPDRIPGGSSGGSGATVASGGAFMAMGSDTGGSIRIPAALCGTVGLKPTFGRISRVGVTPLSWSLDHMGPLTRTVEDAAICLQALAGYDPRDPVSLNECVPDYSARLGDDIKGLRVGVPTNYFFHHVESQVEQSVRAVHKKLEELGAVLVEVALPMPEQYMALEFAICMPEASAYHQRMLRDRPQDYDPGVRISLEAGEMIPATTYIQALRVRNLLQQDFRKLYDKLDVIVAPTVAATAVNAGIDSLTWPDGTQEPLTSAYCRFSVPANLTGLPSLSVPCGFSSAGLPIGFQAIGRPLEEEVILRLGAAYQRATDWSARRPQL